MSLEEAIEIRRSRRKYHPTPLNNEAVDELQQQIARYVKEAGIRMELVLDNGDAFSGLRRSYGMFSGVRHYIGLISKEKDPLSVEKLAYYGQYLVLKATALGLGSCWVSGSFDRSACPFSLAAGETIACVIVVGNAAEDLSTREKLIHNLVHRKTKSIEEMYVSDCDAPEWFIQGMKAVQKAPSAANRQPVKFSFANGKVSAWIEDDTDDSMRIDFGIAKCHFEMGAGGGTWGWGNHAEFTPETP